MDPRVKNILERAKLILSNSDKIDELIGQVKERLTELSEPSETRKQFIQKLQTLSTMIKMHFSGEYRAFSAKTILAFIFGLVYFVTPTDLIPDFIPALGFGDDIALLYWIFKNFADDIHQFESYLPEND